MQYIPLILQKASTVQHARFQRLAYTLDGDMPQALTEYLDSQTSHRGFEITTLADIVAEWVLENPDKSLERRYQELSTLPHRQLPGALRDQLNEMSRESGEASSIQHLLAIANWVLEEADETADQGA